MNPTKIVLIIKRGVTKEHTKSLENILGNSHNEYSHLTDVKSHSIELITFRPDLLGNGGNVFIQEFAEANKLKFVDTNQATSAIYIVLDTIRDSGLRQAGIDAVRRAF